MTRTQLYLPENQYEELKRLASLRRQTFAALMRELIEEKLNEGKKLKGKQKQKNALSVILNSLPIIEKLKGGKIKDLSIHHDEYLYGKNKLV